MQHEEDPVLTTCSGPLDLYLTVLLPRLARLHTTMNDPVNQRNMSFKTPFQVPFKVDKAYKHAAAYFCMEFGIDQSLKIYSGGLGFLAGSHMRSAYNLRQNLIGIGIKWTWGYYDQMRNQDGSMKAEFLEKQYDFLEDTGITFDIQVNAHPVKVKAFYLAPETFGTAPMFLLSTDIPENDYLARQISKRLYDSNVEAKIAQYILLGKGGAVLLEKLGFEPDTYHFNEAHALPAAFHLYEKLGNLEQVREKCVVTTHTPVKAGNEVHSFNMLNKLTFFGKLSADEVRELVGVQGDEFNQTLATLRMSRLSNGVSKIHGEVARDMWGEFDGICPITHITNAQERKYWQHEDFAQPFAKGDMDGVMAAKRKHKVELLRVVADQTGKLMDPDVLTIVWARRFAGYKRADLITRDLDRFEKLLNDSKRPVQIIWAGKPYPTDYDSVSVWDRLVNMSRRYPNMAVLHGYELHLSAICKRGSDVWLNNPRIPREASGTSGMTSAMNAGVNFSTHDGWIPEFAKDGVNCFVIPPVLDSMDEYLVDQQDLNAMYDILEQQIVPLYYTKGQKKWKSIVKQSMTDIVPFFGSDRMADDYYTVMYTSDPRVVAMELEGSAALA